MHHEVAYRSSTASGPSYCATHAARATVPSRAAYTIQVLCRAPLGLDELELPAQVGAHEDEHDAAVGAVVFQRSLREHGAVGGASAQRAVNSHVHDLVCQGVARVH